MKENGFFGTAFRGFRKEDVLHYIDELNAAHCEELSSLQHQLVALKEENTALQGLKEEIETLRAQAEQAEALRAELETAQQKAAVVQADKDALQVRLTNAEQKAAMCAHLQNENAVLQKQLDAQAEQLATYEKMFGDSKQAVDFIKEDYTARMQETHRQTQDVLTEMEKITAQLATELERVREKAAAVRAQAVKDATEDENALNSWLEQFAKAAPRGADTHFF